VEEQVWYVSMSFIHFLDLRLYSSWNLIVLEFDCAGAVIGLVGM